MDIGIRDSVSKENMGKAADMISEADLVLVIGTTGFRSDEYLSRMKPETKLVQINPARTAFDSFSTINIRAGADEVFSKLL